MILKREHIAFSFAVSWFNWQTLARAWIIGVAIAFLIINLLQMLSELYWAPGTIGFASKFNKRRLLCYQIVKKHQ